MSAYEESGFFGKLAIVLAILTALLITLGIALDYGYLPSSAVLGLSAPSVWVFTLLSLVGALMCSAADSP